ncbi:MAG TPA: hypothetical protein VIL35_15990 [Vicinamibacterales bacterium]
MTEYRAADLQAPPQVDRLQRLALLAGAVGVVGSILGYLMDPEQFLRSYLMAFIYWIALPLGALGLMMVHHLSGGGWGMPIRRILEAASRTLPFLALLGIPILLGLGHVFEWSHADVVAKDPILQAKEPYLNTGFFLARYVIYFVIWSGLAYILSGWSRAQDEHYTPGSERKFRLLSGPGLILYALASTFAAVDWIMSLDPHWFSTIFGLLFLIQQGVAAMAFVLLMLASLARSGPLASVIKPVNVHDCGKLLLAFVMIWAYFAFSQFLIIWSANLPEEIPWYLARMSHGWEWVGLFLLVGQFFLPFFLLLSRDLKRNVRRVASVAAFVLVMRYVDFFWNMAPALGREAPMVHWMDLAALLGLGGIWLALFAMQYRARPLLPIGDPYLPEALASHGAH